VSRGSKSGYRVNPDCVFLLSVKGLGLTLTLILNPTSAGPFWRIGAVDAVVGLVGGVLAFTRYCRSQYCVVYIAIAEGRGQTLLRNSVDDDAVGWGT